MILRSPHSWDDVTEFYSQGPKPSTVMLQVIASVRGQGLDAVLLPLFSHWSLSVSHQSDTVTKHVKCYPSSGGTVRLELLEGYGAETRLLEEITVPDVEAVAAFNGYLGRVMADT